MKRYLATLAILPAAGHAHGDHAHVAEEVHWLVHAAPMVGLALVLCALGYALYARWWS